MLSTLSLRRPAAISMLLATAGFTGGCGNRETADAQVGHLTLGTFSKALGNAPYHVAKHKGWFDSSAALEGIRISYVEFNDRPAIASAFARRQLDFLFSAEIPSILIRAQGEDTRIAVVSGSAAQEVLVPVSSPIQSVGELRGHQVSVQAGTSSHFGLVKILTQAGVSPDQVTLTLMPAAEGRAAFEAGRLDAWAVWAPWVETQEVAGRGRVLPESDARIYSVGTMRSELQRAHPEVARALVDVIRRAKAWIVENPIEAQQIVAAELGFELAVVERAWPKFHWQEELDTAAVADFQAKAQFLADQRLTRDNRVVDILRDLIDTTFATRGP